MSVVDVAKQSDVLIISVPMKAIQQFPPNLFDGARPDLIVVDTGNYYSMRDGRIEPLESGVPETKLVADQLGRPVVKAFNNISIDSLRNHGRPKGCCARSLACRTRGHSAPVGKFGVTVCGVEVLEPTISE